MNEDVKRVVTRSTSFGVNLPMGVAVETSSESANSAKVDPFYRMFDGFFGSQHVRRYMQATTESTTPVHLALIVPKSKRKETAELLRSLAAELEEP